MTLEIGIAFIILLGLIVLNVPIWAALMASGTYLMIVVNHMPLQTVYTTLFEGITKNSLLAIPFFVIAGNFIAGGSLGRRLVDVFATPLRNVKAGTPIACLLANAIFGAISGSPPAATAVFSKIVHKPIMESDGESMATGLVVSAAGLASIIPPSVIMIIYGIATDNSISRMFMAGIIPGLVIVAIITIYLIFKCKKRVKRPLSSRELKKVFVASVPVIILPILVLGGIYTGIVTATEAGALSAVYCFLVSIFVLKEIKWKQVPGILGESLITSGQVFILIAASAFFARALTLTTLPAALTATFGSMSKLLFLLLLNVLLLIVGCFFDPSAAILILAPMLLPAATALGIDPIHLGIVFTVNLSVGMFTPPFGLNIFVAQSVLGYDMKRITKALVPYIGLYLLGVLLITYIPILSLFLPNLIG